MGIRRIITLLVVAISGLIIVGLIIPTETEPSQSTRVILEHHEETYIAPVCFEDAAASNHIEETTLERALELNYQPHSSCTEEALTSEQNSFIVGLLKDIGILSKKWDNW